MCQLRCHLWCTEVAHHCCPIILFTFDYSNNIKTISPHLFYSDTRITIFEKWPISSLFFIVLYFQTHSGCFFNKFMWKMSIQYTMLGFEPITFGTWVSPITTRPGLPPDKNYFLNKKMFSFFHQQGRFRKMLSTSRFEFGGKSLQTFSARGAKARGIKSSGNQKSISYLGR